MKMKYMLSTSVAQHLLQNQIEKQCMEEKILLECNNAN